MDFMCYSDKNYEVKVRAEGSMNCVYWHANGDWITEFVQKLNGNQQPQIVYDDESGQEERSGTSYHEMDEDDASSRSSESEDMKRMEVVILEYINQQLDLEKRICEQDEDAENLRSQIEMIGAENTRLQDELGSLQKQKEAFVEGGGAAELKLLKLTEDLTAEKQAISNKYEVYRRLFEKQSQQLEAALEMESKKLQAKEREHVLEVEDLQAQIDALQKQISSNLKFSAEQTTERELEREEFQQEISLLHDELEKQHELHRSDSKLSQEVTYLEEEMEARDLAYREKLAKMKEAEEKRKYMLREYEENLQDLREKELEGTELDVMRRKLSDTAKDRDVIKQELCDSLVKVSKLEAKLMQLKHSNGYTIAIESGADNPAQVETLKMQLAQEREANESKIEHLVEVQDQLRAEVLEKNEEIDWLRHELKNIELKGDHMQKDEGFMSSLSPSFKLEGLSKQIWMDKIGNLNELQPRLQKTKVKNLTSYSESYRDEKKDSLMKQLKEENNRLQSRLQQLEKQFALGKVLQQVESGISGTMDNLHAKDFPSEEASLLLKEELSALKQENRCLKAETRGLRESFEASTNSSLFGGSAEINERIRHLEVLLEKEKKSGDSARDGEDEDSSTVTTKAVLQEKLQELENEMKSRPQSIFGRILGAKDEKILQRDRKIKEAECTLTEQNDKMNELQEKVSDLEHNLTEPDVKVHMRSKGKKGKDGEEKEIEVEKLRPENVKEISTVVKRVKIIRGKPVITKTVCTVQCNRVAIYF